MTDTNTLWAIEHRLWTGGVQAYEKTMAPECVMVFPQPAGILDHPAILEALKGAPRWDDIGFDRPTASQIDEGTIVLAYLGRGLKGVDTYEALCSSTYRRISGEWRIIQHQQTPIGEA